MIDTLIHAQYFTLFLVIGLGIAIGQIKIKGVKFDLSAVIFVALFLGHVYHLYGMEVGLPPIIQQMGLLLFIYSIGMQAGPSFFSMFKSHGVKMLVLAAVTIASAVGVAFGTSFLLGLDHNISLGLFTGALTSTPGLAAAIEASGSPLASIGYGIAYPFGVIGVIVFIQLSPKLFRRTISLEEQRYVKETTAKMPQLRAQNFIVNNPNVYGKTIEELDVRTMTHANISRILKPNNEMISPLPTTVIAQGDLLRAVGTDDALGKFELLMGSKTDAKIPQSGDYEVKWYVVTNKKVVNKSLLQLNLMQNYRATVTRVRRAGIDMTAHPRFVLRYGDKVLVSCSKGNVDGVTQLLGNSLKRLNETSFLPVALGIVIGVILGTITIPLGGEKGFKLGLTGGTLLAALILSFVGKTGPVLWNLPASGNVILKQFGLLLFLTPVGLEAGSHLAETIAQYGIGLFGVGALVTIIPMFITLWVGLKLMKMNFLTLLGVLTGGMTSTPGLSAIDNITESEAPSVAYATVYPLALVLLVIVCQVIGTLI